MRGKFIARLIVVDVERKFLITQPKTRGGEASKTWFTLGGYVPRPDSIDEILYPGSAWTEHHLRADAKRMGIEVGEIKKIRDYAFKREKDGQRVYVVHYWAKYESGQTRVNAYQFADAVWERVPKVLRHPLPGPLREDMRALDVELHDLQKAKAILRRTTNDG